MEQSHNSYYKLKKVRVKDREAIKALVRCAHYVACHHVAHTTNYEDLVSLAVSYGAQPLAHFIENAANNATHCSTTTVIGFVEAIGTWVEESLLSRLQQAPYCVLMSDKCIDVEEIKKCQFFVAE